MTNYVVAALVYPYAHTGPLVYPGSFAIACDAQPILSLLLLGGHCVHRALGRPIAFGWSVFQTLTTSARFELVQL